MRQLGISLKGGLRELEYPGADDAAVIPEPGELSQVEAEWRGFQDFEALGITLKHRVLDAVVDHFRVMAGAGRAGIGVPIRRGQRLEDRLRLLEDRLVAAHH